VAVLGIRLFLLAELAVIPLLENSYIARCTVGQNHSNIVVTRGIDVVQRLASEQALIVLGKDDPSIMQGLFGTTTEGVAEKTLSSVLVFQLSFEN
jgi:hypothetical protein